VVPVAFSVDIGTQYIGGQGGWGYIAGNGQKLHNSGTGLAFAIPYTVGDTIGVQLDFEAKTIEYFKNGESFGVAFTNLSGPVCAAVSTVGKLAKITFIPAISSDGAADDRKALPKDIPSDTWHQRLEVIFEIEF